MRLAPILALIILAASSNLSAFRAYAETDSDFSARFLHPEALTSAPDQYLEQLYPNMAHGWSRKAGAELAYRIEVLTSGSRLAAEVDYRLSPSPDGSRWQHQVLSLEYPATQEGQDSFAFIPDEAVRARIKAAASYEQRGMVLLPFMVRQSSFTSPIKASTGDGLQQTDLKQRIGYGVRRANTIYWFDAQGEIAEAPPGWH